MNVFTESENQSEGTLLFLLLAISFIIIVAAIAFVYLVGNLD